MRTDRERPVAPDQEYCSDGSRQLKDLVSYFFERLVVIILD